MLRPRIIPCLLVHKGGLVKTVRFGDAKYVGDPINAVRIFNEKEADELMVLDIDATREGAEPNYDLIAKLAAECRMPLCYGGGVRTPAQALRIIDAGVEKVAMSAAAVADPGLVTTISQSVGRQSVVVILDVRRKAGLFGSGYRVYTHNGTRLVKEDLMELAVRLQEAGAGEVVVNAIDRDGTMQGYDLALAREMRAGVQVPLTILGGAGTHQHLADLLRECGTVGAAAGSMFVFKGSYRAVLISYPDAEQKKQIRSALLPAVNKIEAS